MSRYVERAENVARFIDVNLQLVLDAPLGREHQWQPLVNATGDEKEFAKYYESPTQEEVVDVKRREVREKWTEVQES
jgi:uncharacterized alpha-E superfamily protein